MRVPHWRLQGKRTATAVPGPEFVETVEEPKASGAWYKLRDGRFALLVKVQSKPRGRREWQALMLATQPV